MVKHSDFTCIFCDVSLGVLGLGCLRFGVHNALFLFTQTLRFHSPNARRYNTRQAIIKLLV